MGTNTGAHLSLSKHSLIDVNIKLKAQAYQHTVCFMIRLIMMHQMLTIYWDHCYKQMNNDMMIFGMLGQKHS